MKKFLKIVRHWKRVVEIISLAKAAYEDGKITGTEAEIVLDKTIGTLVEMGIIKEQ